MPSCVTSPQSPVLTTVADIGQCCSGLVALGFGFGAWLCSDPSLGALAFPFLCFLSAFSLPSGELECQHHNKFICVINEKRFLVF